MHPEYNSDTYQTDSLLPQGFCSEAETLFYGGFIIFCLFFFPLSLEFSLSLSLSLGQLNQHRWGLRSTYIYLYSFLFIGGKG